MNRPYLPNDNHLIISFQELELAWRMLATPDKLSQVMDTLQTVQTMNRLHGPQQGLMTMLTATAWLTEESQATQDQEVSYDC